MIITASPLAGVFVIEAEPVWDNRGFFARTYCRQEFEAAGIRMSLAQIGMSQNTRAGTVRGLHLQRPPHPEIKLVRVTRGAIFDVAVDVRSGSATYGQWFATELSDANHRQILIPGGFAHGFQTLCDDTDVAYHISAPYVPGDQDGIRWDDPDIAIAWPRTSNITISERDHALKSFAAFEAVQM